MGPMGVVINVIASFTVDIYIIYHITYIYILCVSYTHTYMYRYISIVPSVHPVSNVFSQLGGHGVPLLAA